LAGELTTKAERNVQFMAAKQIVIGIMAQCQLGLRTIGSNSRSAKHALQKARVEPRASAGQTLSRDVCVKNPLVLHKIDANTTNQIPGVNNVL
jgi:hypothetical protein